MGKQLDLKALLESKLGDIEPLECIRAEIEAANKVPRNLMFEATTEAFQPETKPVTTSGARGLTVEEAKLFDDEMNRFIDTVLIQGTDYGIIPHCNKPTLLKSGAEKIMNYLGLISRVEIINRVEDYNKGFFSYETKVFLIDYNGVIKAEGIAIANTREGKYAKQNGFSVQNVVLKMAKKRALVDGVLNAGNLSARFTQDVEDLNIEPEHPSGRNPEELSAQSKLKSDKPATQRQINYLETLMSQNNTSTEAMNRYTSSTYGVDDYRKLTGIQVSHIIEKYKSIEK